MDWYIYNGELTRGADLEFIEMVAKAVSSERCSLILVSQGGSPDAAYKIARYLQERYEHVTVIVPGLCKSAGTLVAIGATELVLTPYGELGPLDIQLAKDDRISGFESGLNISEAFSALEERARETYDNTVAHILASSGGIVTFPTAAHTATEFVGSLYGPIFGRIDPEEVGSRTRAMRIAYDYGARLNQKWQNMRHGSLERLSQTYSSHGFVIDASEAEALFERVRGATSQEMRVVEGQGKLSRLPQMARVFRKLDVPVEIEAGEENDDKTPESVRADDERSVGEVGLARAGDNDSGDPGAAVGGAGPASEIGEEATGRKRSG